MDASESLPVLSEPPGSPGELVVQNGRLSGARRALTVPLTLIGQASGCDIRLNVDGVSPLHCAILVDPNWVLLRDLDSSTGTRVNGQAVVAHRLVDGDRIEIGPFHFSVSLNAPATSELPNDHGGSAREREAVRIQAAAVAAQQLALMEEEGRLQQRATALQSHEAQLVGHLEERQQQLEEAEEQLRRDRAAFEQERTRASETLLHAEKGLAEAKTQVEQERQKAIKERQRLVELRRRLKKRWKRHFDAREAQLKAAQEEVSRDQQRLSGERTRVAAFQEKVNGELELGRRQLREEWQQLGLAQQRWDETFNHQTAVYKRQQQELADREARIATLEQAVVNEQHRWQQQQAARGRETEGLEVRIRNQRTQLEALQREAARQEGRRGGPVVANEPVTFSETSAPVVQEQWPGDLGELAGTLHDQRRHLVEQWERLLQVQESWQQERTAALADLEATATGLSQREMELRTAERLVESSQEEVRQRREALSQLRSALEGRQTQLTMREASWLAEREAALEQLALRERQLQVRSQHLEIVHQRRNRRRQQEVAELKAARDRCDEARRQSSALWQECEQLRETLNQQERTLASRALALERYRQETTSQSVNSARAEARLDRLARTEAARLESEMRHLGRERGKLEKERSRLDEHAALLLQLEEELTARQRDWTDQVAQEETRQSTAEQEEERRQQELRQLRALHGLSERHLRQLRDELERIAGVMIEEAEVPASGPQAA